MVVIIHTQANSNRLLKLCLKRKEKMEHKGDLVHAASYLLKLQTDPVILIGIVSHINLPICKTGGVPKIYINIERYCK